MGAVKPLGELHTPGGFHFFSPRPTIMEGMGSRILVVDDDSALAEMLTMVLEGHGFEVVHAVDGNDAIDQFEETDPDLILLDVMLPFMSGIQVCEKIRESSGVPIIMLTARTDTDDIVRGLEAGADDYVVKPFNPAELTARIRARLRDTNDEEPEVLQVADLTIDVSAHEVKRGGEPIQLTPLEFDLLVVLARKPQQVHSRELLLEKVWGYQYKADTRLVNVHVQRLRAKVEIDPENPQVVLTVRGVGYRAGAPVT